MQIRHLSRAALTQSTQDSHSRWRNDRHAVIGQPVHVARVPELRNDQARSRGACAQMSFHVERLECFRARRRLLSRACRGVTREAARYGSSVVEGCGRVVVVARIEGQMLELADMRHGSKPSSAWPASGSWATRRVVP